MSWKVRTGTVEQELIEAIKGFVGDSFIGDDCAVLPGQMLATSDSLVEGTHFLLPRTTAADLGWKAIAVNLSDIAAMAGRPRHILIDLSMPADFPGRLFRSLFQSMSECARTYRTTIVGGDLTRGALLTISVTALGEVHERGCLRRSGARPGDIVAVTGDFGASAAGLFVLEHGLGGYPHCRQRHCRPLPRLCESWALVRQTGSRGALMDASDGLADALIQVARASRVGMEIELDAVPVHRETVALAKLACVDAYRWALYGGEDYELVAAIPPSVWSDWQQAPDNPFQAIGAVTDSGRVVVKGDAERELDPSQSFQHWTNLV